MEFEFVSNNCCCIHHLSVCLSSTEEEAFWPHDRDKVPVLNDQY